jgi:hypothetical protein
LQTLYGTFVNKSTFRAKASANLLSDDTEELIQPDTYLKMGSCTRGAWDWMSVAALCGLRGMLLDEGMQHSKRDVLVLRRRAKWRSSKKPPLRSPAELSVLAFLAALPSCA